MTIIRHGTFTPPEIRMELYALLNEIREMQNHHLQDFGREHGERQNCPVCKVLEANKDGVRKAIKRFGGLPRFGKW